MATVIKATDRDQGLGGVLFNLEDLNARGTKFLEKVRAEAAAEAAKIVKKAKDEADAIRKKAEAEGRKAGQAAMDQAVSTQLSKQLATLIPALKQVIQDLHHAKQAWLTHWEKSAVHLSAAIAARVIRRESLADPQIPLKLVREALELASGSPQVTIRLSPADHTALKPQLAALMQELGTLSASEIVSDPAITQGGCRLETKFGVIDQQFETQLQRIEEELT